MLRQAKDFRIADAGQIKSCWIESRSGRLSAFCFQNFSHPINTSGARAYVNQTADDISNHVIKEGVCLDTNLDESSETNDMQIFNIFHRRLALAPCGTETGEIMFADQELACGFHVLFVERTEDPAGSAGKNRRTNRLIDDPVFISPTASGKPRMEFVRDDFRPANPHIPSADKNSSREPKKSPYGRLPYLNGSLDLWHEPWRLCAGTDGFNFFTRKLNNGRFEIILDCLSGRLGLPALERTAVVLES